MVFDEERGIWLPMAEEVDPTAAEAIRELATAVIQAVTAVDATTRVGRFFRELRVISRGPGNFSLDIIGLRGEDTDAQALAAEIAQQSEILGGFSKPLRPIQLTPKENSDGNGQQA
jgi:hypothetical protein